MTRTLDQRLDDFAKQQDVLTPAGGGDVSPAAKDCSTSQGLRFPGEAFAVAAPPEPDEAPAEASADETVDGKTDPEEFFDYALSWPPEDDTDEFAFPRSRSVLFSASSDGIISIHHRHSAGITLTAAQARELYEFLTNVAIIWRNAK